MAVEVERSRAEGVHVDLLADGIAVRDGFLSPARLTVLAGCAALRRGRGEFAAARVGADQRLQRRQEIRGDSICWLAEPLFQAERELLADLERLRLDINREAYLGLFDLELHYSWYPPGAGYARHVDQLQERQQRKVSVVLYLNDTRLNDTRLNDTRFDDPWLNESGERGAGGELRIFGAGERFRDIQPVGGRLVSFLTAGTEHAVLPTRRGRSSISGSFRGRE